MSSQLIRWSGLAAMLGGMLWLGHGLAVLVHPAYWAFREPADYLVSGLYSAALLALAVGFAGLHAWQGGRAGRVGTSGSLLACGGASLAGVGNLAEHAFGLGAVGWWVYLPGILGLTAGWLLLSVATVRAGVLPHWCGWALGIGLLGLLLVARGGGLLVGLGWLALGYGLWAARNAGPARTEPAMR